MDDESGTGETGRTRFRLPRGAGAALLALGVYVLVSFLYFGLPVVSDPRGSIAGNGVDPQIFIWSFAWWPHALLDGTNPFHADVVWVPHGLNLAWTTTIPVLALLLAPVTLAAGPVVAYNVAAVLLPALAAWTAYLLARYLTGRFWPALFAGYVFGFSSYVLGHQQGHLHMTSVFLLPLVALVVVRWVRGELRDRGLALSLGLLFAAQLGLATEHALTAAIALAAGLLLAYAVDAASRPRLRRIVRPLAGGVGVAMLLAAPLLVSVVRDFEPHSINPPSLFPADLANLVFPTGIQQLSYDWGMSGLARRFPGNDAESGAYLGVPLLVMVALYGAAKWRTAGGRFLLGAFALAVVAALGTALHVAGEEIVTLPYAELASLPLLNNVLPVRWIVYATLAAAVASSLWLASAGRRWPRVLLPVLALVSLLPHFGTVPYLGHGYWESTLTRPAFFADGLYRDCLREGETILALPFGPSGDSMLWQAESEFRFGLAGGYLSPSKPREYTGYPGFGHMADGNVIGGADLRRLLEDKGATSIILVDREDMVGWREELDGEFPGRVEIGGVFVYPLAGEACGAVAS